MSEPNLTPPLLSPRENHEENKPSSENENNNISEPPLQNLMPDENICPNVKPETQVHLLSTKKPVKRISRRRSSKVKKLFELKSTRLIRTREKVPKLNTKRAKLSSAKTSPSTLEVCESLEGAESKFKIEPELFGYQMVGDSQFCRFGEQLLGLARTPNHLPWGSIGICVSGQTIPDLHKRVKEKFYPLSDKIILMIGTNDFLRNKDVKTICRELSELVNTLQETSSDIILLTLPPIPRLAKINSKEHLVMLEKYNRYILGLKDGGKIRVADISSMYITPSHPYCKINLFEKYFRGGPRRYDMIHLNREGLEAMREFIRKTFQ